MRSEKQRNASRTNGAKSRGPTTPEGKNKVRFNGLKHRLCAKHVILPGEDAAAFEAERQAWINDFNPTSHTRSVLVERAAVASWRLKRSVKAEAAFLAERADNAGYAFDFDRHARVERALCQGNTDPGGALSLLELDATGIDRLIASCGELERALAAGPGAWNLPIYHKMLMFLTGTRLDENPHYAGPIAKASAQLLAANNSAFAAKPCFDYGFLVVVFPLPDDEHQAAVELLRKTVAEKLDQLRELRRGKPDPAELRARAVAAAYVDGTEEGKLRHRYEMAIERSLKATIGQLVMLEKSGADLAGHEPQNDAPQEDATKSPSAQCSGSAVAPGSVGAGKPGVIPSRPAAPRRGAKGSKSVRKRAGRRRSRR